MWRMLFFTTIFLSFFAFDTKPKNEIKTEYALTSEPIDVVIPCCSKDLETLELCIEGIKKNCCQIRRVIVISSEKLTDNAEWFDESCYPFSKKDVALYLFSKDMQGAEKYSSRLGWYYQQLLKLYAPFVIPHISSNVLVLDADTIFLNPVKFLSSSNGGLYNIGIQYHPPYFAHANRLSGHKIRRIYPQLSGITHHMLFQKAVLEDLFREVEALHHQEFWKSFCNFVEDLFAGASEYELYFNFAFGKTDQVNIRKLKWANIGSLENIDVYKKQGFHFVSCHDWYRENNKR